MIRIKCSFAQHHSYEILFRQIMILCVSRKHMDCLDLLAETQIRSLHPFRSCVPESDHVCIPIKFPLAVVPVFSFVIPGFGNIFTENCPQFAVFNSSVKPSVIHIHLQWKTGLLFFWQIRQICRI